MKKTQTISTGSELLDDFLDGGFEKNIITTIYGPAGSGKTNISLIALCQVIKNGGKVLYVDTEGSFSVSRAEQILPDFEKYANNVLFLRPFNFDDQKKAFAKLQQTIQEEPEDYHIIIIDSIAMLYRLEVGKTLDVSFVNKELAIQLGLLTEITRKYDIPILITNQVYADFERKDLVKMVGGDLLKYTSKCLIELKKGHKGVRVAKLIKHRSLGEGKEVAFQIVQKGIQKAHIPSSPLKNSEDLL
ncbi:MAG: DNA repair and recombination protein RadB [Candidatus Woesearchaeota archaeon]